MIAAVRQDDASFSCEDSCVYANDGECDEDQVCNGRFVTVKIVEEAAAASSCLFRLHGGPFRTFEERLKGGYC